MTMDILSALILGDWKVLLRFKGIRDLHHKTYQARAPIRQGIDFAWTLQEISHETVHTVASALILRTDDSNLNHL